MRWLQGAASLAALVGLVRGQGADSSPYVDSATGIVFASYVNDRNITFRVAVPDVANATGGFDAIIQITAPIAVGWAGLAWGGSMTYNPLSIAWANGTTNTVISSRYAYGYYVPPAYPDATYTVLGKGSFVNTTHWQITTKCTGCTRWGDDSVGITTLEPKGQNPLAFAYGMYPVDTPKDNSSSFSIHDSIGHPIFDFGPAVNKNFGALVTKNL